MGANPLFDEISKLRARILLMQRGGQDCTAEQRQLAEMLIMAETVGVKVAATNIKRAIPNIINELRHDIAREDVREAEASRVDEQRLMHDFEYFCANCIQIPYRPGLHQDYPDGGYGAMYLSPAQKKVVAVYVRTLFIEQKPLRSQTLKTRQLGNTTLLLAFAIWLMQKIPGFNVMLIIDKMDHSRTKRLMVIEWLKHMCARYSCFSPIEKGSQNEKMLRLKNKSWLFFESSESTNPGTSEKLDMLIESEKPKWVKGRAQLVKNSVTPGIPFRPMTVHIDESTAMGQEDFYRKWVGTTSDPNSGVIPIFLPWYVSPEYAEPLTEDFTYSNDAAFRDYDLDEDREISEQEYAIKYNLTDEQVLWRRTKIRDQFEGSIVGFNQEYPTTPDHAYSGVQHGFFPKSILEFVRLAKRPAERYAIVDTDGYSDHTRTLNHFELNPRVLHAPNGDLYIREMPKVGRRYFIGVDVAEGKIIVNEQGKDDPDYTIVSVHDEDDVTVAYLITRDKPEECWLRLVLLGKFYNYAYVNGERNGPGATLLAYFWSTNYPNNLVDRKPRARPPKDRAWTVVNKSNRGLLLRALRASWSAKKARMFVFSNCDETLDKQVYAFVIRVEDGQPEAAPGFHDDILFADAHATRMRAFVMGDEHVLRDDDEAPVQVAVNDNEEILSFLEDEHGFSFREVEF